MQINITKQEAQWLLALVKKDKDENAKRNKNTPHPLYELRRDNMESLKNKIESAIQKHIKREEQSR